MPTESPPETPDIPELPKTTGEKFYDAAQFVVGKVMILAATAALAYTARYGKDNYRGVPNYLKHFQEWFHNKLITHAVEPLNGGGELARRAAGAAANTMIICHGGNAFAPVMKWMENNREDIANWYNRRWGKPGEVEIAHERLKDTPQQTWGDIIKGRTIAWGAIFGSFLAIDAAIGKDRKSGLYHFDKYEEWFGRRLAGLAKSGRDIAQTPVGHALTPAQDANKLYRLGKITALDLYATSAAIVIWNFLSRRAAQKRHEEKGLARENKEAPTVAENIAASPGQSRRFSDALNPQSSFTAAAADRHEAPAPSL